MDVIIEHRSLCMEPELVIDYSDYERRLRAIEERGWITKNGRHILIGEDSGSGGKSGKKVDKSGKSGIIKTENQKRLQEMIDDGDVSLDINEEMQNRHYKGTHEYNELLKKGVEKSYFNVPQVELQKFLKKNATHGKIKFDRNGNARETLYFKKNAAYDTKVKQNTSYVTAHYSKTRTHLSPYTPKTKK